MKSKKRNKFLSPILIFSFIITPINIQPIRAFENIKVDNEKIDIHNSNEATTKEKAHILEELEDKRQESSKSFKMSDGTTVTADYGTPVHFKENGKWVQYDNSLKNADDNQEKLENKKSNKEIRLSKNAKM